ncbi:SDR family oxidoreductase [Priestia filamentosa]|uniref:SDR family oxidoreductase n=1 Tax=Priestia filamentosa TaxID=1402861 RepID=UPI000A08BBB0|nr:SDR family oxidoreductase [Priestia filamentosa]OXS64685.1 gluconate 5-dehydrogenase [Priestia filamentosa]SMF75173.1 gluconate 5-dehydrogenase [Priestia filamentosa]
MHKLFDLTNKTAIVTGGGTGLGKQMAIALAEAGANVVVCSRKIGACQETSKQIKDIGADSLALKCDVTNIEEIQNVIHETEKEFGNIDILINNSGTSWMAPFLEMPADKWDKVMEVNVKGVFLFSQAVGKVMKKQKSGKIINISSIAGILGQQDSFMDACAYSTSKGAIISLTRDLSSKLAPHNVQVNAIAPGFFPTRLTKALGNVSNHVIARTPSGKFGSDEDLKGAAIFLSSNASNYVTGQVLVVDGGLSATL